MAYPEKEREGVGTRGAERTTPCSKTGVRVWDILTAFSRDGEIAPSEAQKSQKTIGFLRFSCFLENHGVSETFFCSKDFVKKEQPLALSFGFP